MELEIRIAGKRKKYYLAHSIRDGKKVKKIRRYLGADLSEKQLKKLRERAEIILQQHIEAYKTIADPLKTMLRSTELALVKGLVAKGDIKIKHLSEKQWQDFTEVFTYNTNAIEGSQVTQDEVKEILENNNWPQDVKKEDISETYGVAEAITYIRNTKEHLSLPLLKKLHFIVFKNSKPFAGKFRAKGIEVVIRDGTGMVIHRGAPASQIESLLKELVLWYNKNKKKYPALVLAAVVHNQFENIHPFQDGNGRVGRLLLNNILLKHKLPPLNIGFNNRRDYYYTLQEYEKKGNLHPTLELMVKEYKMLKKQLGDYKR